MLKLSTLDSWNLRKMFEREPYYCCFGRLEKKNTGDRIHSGINQKDKKLIQ